MWSFWPKWCNRKRIMNIGQITRWLNVRSNERKHTSVTHRIFYLCCAWCKPIPVCAHGPYMLTIYTVVSGNPEVPIRKFSHQTGRWEKV